VPHGLRRDICDLLVARPGTPAERSGCRGCAHRRTDQHAESFGYLNAMSTSGRITARVSRGWADFSGVQVTPTFGHGAVLLRSSLEHRTRTTPGPTTEGSAQPHRRSRGLVRTLTWIRAGATIEMSAGHGAAIPPTLGSGGAIHQRVETPLLDNVLRLLQWGQHGRYVGDFGVM
jgi:hypothetical protein